MNFTKYSYFSHVMKGENEAEKIVQEEVVMTALKLRHSDFKIY